MSGSSRTEVIGSSLGPRLPKLLASPGSLNNVKFVNCTFDVEGNQAGAGILQYAALDNDELSIGLLPNSKPTPN